MTSGSSGTQSAQLRRAYRPHRSSITQGEHNDNHSHSHREDSKRQQQADAADGGIDIDDDDDDDFMMRIVHGSCQGVFPGDGDTNNSLCHFPSCHMTDQLDLLVVRTFVQELNLCCAYATIIGCVGKQIRLRRESVC